MRPIDLRFEPPAAHGLLAALRGRAGTGAASRVALAALAASLALLGGVLWQAWQAREEAARARAALARLAPAAPPRPEGGAPPAPALDTRAWNQALRLLGTPWSAVLDALERQAVPGVALVSVEPDAHGHRLRLQAEARTLDALLAYATALREVPGFGEVTLLRHETLEREPQQPVRLAFDVALDGAGPPAAAAPPAAREPAR